MIVNVEQSSFSGMMFTVGRLVRIKSFAGSEVINEASSFILAHWFHYVEIWRSRLFLYSDTLFSGVWMPIVEAW